MAFQEQQQYHQQQQSTPAPPPESSTTQRNSFAFSDGTTQPSSAWISAAAFAAHQRPSSLQQPARGLRTPPRSAPIPPPASATLPHLSPSTSGQSGGAPLRGSASGAAGSTALDLPWGFQGNAAGRHVHSPSSTTTFPDLRPMHHQQPQPSSSSYATSPALLGNSNGFISGGASPITRASHHSLLDAPVISPILTHSVHSATTTTAGGGGPPSHFHHLPGHHHSPFSHITAGPRSSVFGAPSHFTLPTSSFGLGTHSNNGSRHPSPPSFDHPAQRLSQPLTSSMHPFSSSSTTEQHYASMTQPLKQPDLHQRHSPSFGPTGTSPGLLSPTAAPAAPPLLHLPPQQRSNAPHSSVTRSVSPAVANRMTSAARPGVLGTVDEQNYNQSHFPFPQQQQVQHKQYQQRMSSPAPSPFGNGTAFNFHPSFTSHSVSPQQHLSRPNNTTAAPITTATTSVSHAALAMSRQSSAPIPVNASSLPPLSPASTNLVSRGRSPHEVVSPKSTTRSFANESLRGLQKPDWLDAGPPVPPGGGAFGGLSSTSPSERSGRPFGAASANLVVPRLSVPTRGMRSSMSLVSGGGASGLPAVSSIGSPSVASKRNSVRSETAFAAAAREVSASSPFRDMSLSATSRGYLPSSERNGPRCQERVKEVSKVHVQEVITYVPKVVIQEKIIEVPEIEYKIVPIEKIVPVIETREEVRIKEVPIHKHVEVPVAEYRDVEVIKDVHRKVPVPVECVTTDAYVMQTIVPRIIKVPVPVFFPRFVEVAVPVEQLDEETCAMADALLDAVESVCTAPVPSLARVEEVASAATEFNPICETNIGEIANVISDGGHKVTMPRRTQPSLEDKEAIFDIGAGEWQTEIARSLNDDSSSTNNVSPPPPPSKEEPNSESSSLQLSPLTSRIAWLPDADQEDKKAAARPAAPPAPPARAQGVVHTPPQSTSGGPASQSVATSASRGGAEMTKARQGEFEVRGKASREREDDRTSFSFSAGGQENGDERRRTSGTALLISEFRNEQKPCREAAVSASSAEARQGLLLGDGLDGDLLGGGGEGFETARGEGASSPKSAPSVNDALGGGRLRSTPSGGALPAWLPREFSTRRQSLEENAPSSIAMRSQSSADRGKRPSASPSSGSSTTAVADQDQLSSKTVALQAEEEKPTSPTNSLAASNAKRRGRSPEAQVTPAPSKGRRADLTKSSSSPAQPNGVANEHESYSSSVSLKTAYTPTGAEKSGNGEGTSERFWRFWSRKGGRRRADSSASNDDPSAAAAKKRSSATSISGPSSSAGFVQSS